VAFRQRGRPQCDAKLVDCQTKMEGRFDERDGFAWNGRSAEKELQMGRCIFGVVDESEDGLDRGSTCILRRIHKSTLTRALHQMTSFLTVFIRAYGGDPIDPEWIQMTTGEDWKEAYGQKPYEIIDVTEVPMETPDDPYMQRLFYSHYKKRYVCKFLGACHSNCLAAFCSVGFPGSIFDNEICFAGKDHPMLNHAVHRASIRRRTFTDENDENVVVPETIAADRGFCEGLNRQFERDAFRLVHPAFSRGKNVALLQGGHSRHQGASMSPSAN